MTRTTVTWRRHRVTGRLPGGSDHHAGGASDQAAQNLKRLVTIEPPAGSAWDRRARRIVSTDRDEPSAGGSATPRDTCIVMAHVQSWLLEGSKRRTFNTLSTHRKSVSPLSHFISLNSLKIGAFRKPDTVIKGKSPDPQVLITLISTGCNIRVSVFAGRILPPALHRK
jgi:hypothetical protein